MQIAGIGVLVALLHAAAAAKTGSLPVQRPVVRVMVQTEGVLEPRLLGDMLDAAREIWRPYAEVSFEVGAEATSRGLRLVITDRISTLSDRASLGWIEFVDGRPTRLITVSTTAALALMNASRWSGFPAIVRRTFLTRAMGRAIAHELGHYLLASRDHATHGLMRGALTADDIMVPRRANYRLEPSQVRQLERSVLVARQDETEEEGTRN